MIRYILTGIAVLLVYGVIFQYCINRKKYEITLFERIGIIIMGVYLIALCIFELYSTHGFSEVNTVIGKTVVRANTKIIIKQAAMFFPLGAGAVMISGQFRNPGLTFLLGTTVSAILETAKYLIIKTANVDNVIFGICGCIAGYIIAYFCLVAFKRIVPLTGIINKKSGKHIRRDGLIIIVLCVVILISSIVNSAVGKKVNTIILGNDKRLTGIDVECSNAYVVNMSEMTALYGLNAEERIAPASTTKLLTAITVAKYCEPDERVTAWEELKKVASDASVAGLSAGDVLTVKQLLEGMLLPSGNDAAYVLAVYAGRKIANDFTLKIDDALKEFVTTMNKVAKDYGAENSNFMSPDGYDTDGQYTTAKDMAKIAIAFLKNNYADNLLQKTVMSLNIKENIDNGKCFVWNNTNELLDRNSKYFCQEAIGLKTGSTGQAGKCLISAAVINDDTYITVIMGDSDSGRYEDTCKIFTKIRT